MRDYLNESAATRFLFPIDGDCLNERDGIVKKNSLHVCVRIASASGCAVTVNGTPAAEQDGVYCAEVCVPVGRSTLVAKNETDGTTAAVDVFFLTQATGRYGISVDDNIL